MLNGKLEEVIGNANPANFTLADGFRSNKDGTKRTCYPKCSHSGKHVVSYVTANHREGSALEFTWQNKCQQCTEALNAPAIAPVAAPFVAQPMIEIVNMPFDFAAPAGVRNLFSPIRDAVLALLDAQERELMQHPNPLQELLRNETRNAFSMAQAYLGGVATTRLEAQQQQQGQQQQLAAQQQQLEAQLELQQQENEEGEVPMVGLTEEEALEFDDDLRTPMQIAEDAGTAACSQQPTKRARFMTEKGKALQENARNRRK